MNRATRLEQIRKATVEAVEKYRAQRAVLAADTARPVRPGDVYLFPGPSAIDLRWVVLGAHPDKDLLFAVPADGHPLVGLTDVEVSAEDLGGPLALRCGHGLWIHRDEFRAGSRLGALGGQHVSRAMDKLGQMAGGKLHGPASQWEAEANPDYEDWLNELERAVNAVAAALHLREETLTAADFSPRLALSRAEPSSADVEPQFTLAAASSGALARLSEELPLSAEGEPLVRRLNYLYPGEILLVLEPDGIAVVYQHQGGQPPPELRSLDTAGNSHRAEWLVTPRGTGVPRLLPLGWGPGASSLRPGPAGPRGDHPEVTRGGMRSSVWHDQGLRRTNPVHVIEQVAGDLEEDFLWNLRAATRKLAQAVEALSQEGAALPAFKVDELKRRGHLPADFTPAPAPARPGVLGLVVEPGVDLGYVLPLSAQEAPSGWRIDPMLPFHDRDILGALVGLAQASGHPTAGVLPERLAFSFANPLGYRTAGNSMTVAAVLAVIDALDGRRSDLLRCACAVVELGKGGRLQAVRHIRPKLEAVRREYQEGSLLVCVPGCPEAAAFRHRFRTVWEVADLAALAGELHREGLLAPLMRQAPLGQEEFQRVRDHLRWLVKTEHDYRWASDLGQRLKGCTDG
ncbi:MAG: hypothetical protein L0Z62_14585 [Gemmataceae bacterium]|nr:hypothetical protein [Gemmataceae bacterium]